MIPEEFIEKLETYPSLPYQHCCWINQETAEPCVAHADWHIVTGASPDDVTDSCAAHLGDMVGGFDECHLFRVAIPEQFIDPFAAAPVASSGGTNTMQT